jgi:hypothetical protein
MGVLTGPLIRLLSPAWRVPDHYGHAPHRQPGPLRALSHASAHYGCLAPLALPSIWAVETVHIPHGDACPARRHTFQVPDRQPPAGVGGGTVVSAATPAANEAIRHGRAGRASASAPGSNLARLLQSLPGSFPVLAPVYQRRGAGVNIEPTVYTRRRRVEVQRQNII